MKVFSALGIVFVGLGVAGCGSVVVPSDSTGEGGDGQGDVSTGTGATTTTTSTTETGGKGQDDACPATLPEKGTPCTEEDQKCDYAEEPCATRARCVPSYDPVTYGELVWHHSAAADGSACADVGQLCKFSAAAMDSETFYSGALCTESGWVVVDTACLSCGTCPSELPAEGAACDADALNYAHCTYAVQKPCGVVLAYLGCDAGGFKIHTKGCQ